MTPVFDAEIVKLRRRLGDIYNPDGVLITTVNVGSSPEVGEAYKRDELVDIYNDAVREFLNYMVSTVAKKMWYTFVPGYVEMPESPFSVGGSGRLDLAPFNPPLYEVIDVLDASTGKIIVPVSPDEIFSYGRTSFDNVEIFYCSVNNKLVFSKSNFSVAIMYLRDHVNVVHGAANDLPKVTGAGLQRIMLFAEAIARAHKNLGMEGLPEYKLAAQQERDMKGLRNATGSE